MMLLVKSLVEVDSPSFVFESAIVGVGDVLQQCPYWVIGTPPVLLIVPLKVTELSLRFVIDDEQVTVGVLTLTFKATTLSWQFSFVAPSKLIFKVALCSPILKLSLLIVAEIICFPPDEILPEDGDSVSHDGSFEMLKEQFELV